MDKSSLRYFVNTRGLMHAVTDICRACYAMIQFFIIYYYLLQVKGSSET